MRGINTAVALALVTLFALGGAASDAWAGGGDVHYKRGMAFKRKGNLEKAIQSFEAAVAADPNHGMAWASLGHLYKKRNKYEKAVEAYEKATSLLPKQATLWSNLGMSYYRAKRPDDAIDALEKACRLAPRDAVIHANLGAIRRQKGDLKGAIRNLSWAVKLAPKDAANHNNLGLAYRAWGSQQPSPKRETYYKKATDHFKQAIAIDPNEARYYFNAGVVYRRWEKIDEAIEYYQKATEKGPDLHSAWYDLGYMYKINHDNDKAIAAFKKYLQMTKGKDPKADQEVRDIIESLGGR